jgi:hypothetical protein
VASTGSLFCVAERGDVPGGPSFEGRNEDHMRGTRAQGHPSLERRMTSGTLPPPRLQPQGRKIPTTWRLRWFVAAIPGSLSLAQARLVVSEPSARYRPPVGLPEPREGGHMNCGIFNWPWRDAR